MNRSVPLRFVLPVIAVACVAAFVSPARGQRHVGTYARMAPLAQYMMDKNSEIALARSAAPPSISNNARVLILSANGYVTAVKGSNGFTCLVERAWMSAFDDPQFWNPKGRGPVCYNPAASRTVLRYDYRRAKLVLAGLSKLQMYARLKAIVAQNALPTPEPGSMSYMMSKHQYLNDDVGNWYPHLMFHAPQADGANAGASWGRTCPRHQYSWIARTSCRLSRRPSSLYRSVSGPTGRAVRRCNGKETANAGSLKRQCLSVQDSVKKAATPRFCRNGSRLARF